MPQRDWPNPDDIPDMSIPERGNNSDDVYPLARSGADAEPNYGLVPLPSAHGRSAWRTGDPVLAPWEPEFLYVGRITHLERDRALVEFGDGDAGWVTFAQLRPVVIPVGQSLHSRRRMGPMFFPGTVRELARDEALVVFADGTDEWVALAALRIACLDTGPGAEPTRVASHQAFLEHLRPGDSVWAPWNHNVLFAGRVDRIERGELHIHFDDGDQGWVQRTQVFPLLIPVGLRVVCRWKMGGQFFPGTVTAVEGKRVHIQYDDGDREWTRPAALAIPCEPTGPNARPSRTVTHWGSSWSWAWLIFAGISIVLCLLRLGWH